MFLSTLEAYFQGKKHLFKGLAVEKLEQDWKIYPVLHLDLNAEKYDSPKALEAILSSHLTRWEDLYGKGKMNKPFPPALPVLFAVQKKKAGMQVVILGR